MKCETLLDLILITRKQVIEFTILRKKKPDKNNRLQKARLYETQNTKK